MVLTIILPGKRADLQRNLAGDLHKDFSRELWVLPEAGGEVQISRSRPPGHRRPLKREFSQILTGGIGGT